MAGLKQQIRLCEIVSTENQNQLMLNAAEICQISHHKINDGCLEASSVHDYENKVKSDVLIILSKLRDAESMDANVSKDIDDLRDKNEKIKHALVGISQKVSVLETTLGFNSTHT